MAAGGPGLLTAGDEPAGMRSDSPALRTRVVKLAENQPLHPGMLDGARLNFFVDAEFTLQVTDWQVQTPETFTASGIAREDAQTQFVISVADGVVVANL